MAYSYTWPPSLPQTPQKNFSEDVAADVLRTSMDAGVAKVRYRGLKPSVLHVTFIMTSVQVNTLHTFIVDTLRGTSRFGFTHPRTNAIVEARIVPQGDNQYTSTYIAPGYYSVNLQLEVLP